MFSYIGICDFPSGKQAWASANLFAELCGTTMADWKLMIGVMMSFKTLTGKTSKWTAIWPSKKDVANIFIDHPRAFNTLHYADYEGHTRLSNLIAARNWGGGNLHALQLDMIWPSPSQVARFRDKCAGIKIVLQINSVALAAVGDDPTRLVNKLLTYDDTLDYVLLDKSHGKGIGMRAHELLPFAQAIDQELPRLGLAAAGGLGPHTMLLAKPLVQAFPKISIDMQGKLRQSGNAEHPIDWGRPILLSPGR